MSDEPSAAVKKNIISCQPFKDGVASIICSGCFCLMAFPSGSPKVRCAGCHTVTQGLKINCTACKAPMKLELKDREAKCPKCNYLFRPVTVFKLAVPDTDGKGPKPVKLTISCDSSLRPNKNNQVLKALLEQPLKTNFAVWEMQLGISGMSSCDVSNRGEKKDTGKSPQALGLKDGDVLTIVPGDRKVQPGNHDFCEANFNQPTNCAVCQKFIWGLYNQGKKCAKCWAPVHHRCAEAFTQMCEASMRQSLGLSMADFSNSDDAEDESNIPEGYPIQPEDLLDWASMLSEEKSPENDKNFMKTFDKFSNFTDDEIGKLWSKYDADNSGSLDKAEMKIFVCDLLGALAGGGLDNSGIEETVTRVMTAMDTNRDGSIQWEEFYYFYKAQQDNKFLSAFKGIKLTQEKLYEMWYHYDEDNSGVLEPDEVLKLLQECAAQGGAGATTAYHGKLESFFGPGKRVTWEDFCKTLVPMIQSSLDNDL